MIYIYILYIVYVYTVDNVVNAADSSLVSFEAADRPNYFLKAERSGQLRLQKWEETEVFWDAATFVLHRDTWISGFDSLESLAKPGFFLHFMLSRLQLMKYSHSDRYRRATLFKLTGQHVATYLQTSKSQGNIRPITCLPHFFPNHYFYYRWHTILSNGSSMSVEV